MYNASTAIPSLIDTINSWWVTNYKLPGGASKYILRCLVNGTVDYKLDIFTWAVNQAGKLNCPYKNRVWTSGICAVRWQPTPYSINMDQIQNLELDVTPISYCGSADANGTCADVSTAPVFVKDQTSCNYILEIQKPDLVVSKEADQSNFIMWSNVTYRITITNQWSGVAKWWRVEDVMPETLRYDSVSWFDNNVIPETSSKVASGNRYAWISSGNIPAGGSITFFVNTKILTWSISNITNYVNVLTTWESNYANNSAQYTLWQRWTASIWDFVWVDTNKNGIQDVWELGMDKIYVQLLRCDNNSKVNDTFTNGVWFYKIDGINPGRYKLMFEQRQWYVFSPYRTASAGIERDSDVLPFKTVTDCFDITANQQIVNIDAWMYYDPTAITCNKDTVICGDKIIVLNDANHIVYDKDYKIVSYGTWTPNYTAMSCTPEVCSCGNGVIETSKWEQCDGSSPDPAYDCNMSCQLIKKNTAVCGNSIVEQWEQCDANSTLPDGAVCYQCRIEYGSVCGDGKVSWNEECDITSPNKVWYQCIWCVYVPNPFAQCGNGVQEVWEACDLGLSNGTTTPISSWPFAGKYCTTNCNVSNTSGNLINAAQPPSCTTIDPPAIMAGEAFAFRWDINDSLVVDSCTSNGQRQWGKVLRDSMKCNFSLYNGHSGTSAPIKTMQLPCYQPNTFTQNLLSRFNSLSSTAYGRDYLIFDDSIIKGVYGEYKIRLNKIDFSICWYNNWSISTWSIQWSNSAAIQASNERVICEYNFTVIRPYLMQIWNLLSSNQSDSLFNFYWFASNEWTQNILSKYNVNINKVSVNEFWLSSNLTYLMSTFVDKYSKLAQSYLSMWPNATKVPGKNIFVINGDYDYEASKLPGKSTVIVRWNMKINWDVTADHMFVVEGNLTIWTNNCNTRQSLNGVYLVKWDATSDKYYINNNMLANRCEWWWLVINGILVANSIDQLINHRRSNLPWWFINNNKKDAIVNGASLLIRANDNIFKSPAPWFDEFSSELQSFRN